MLVYTFRVYQSLGLWHWKSGTSGRGLGLQTWQHHELQRPGDAQHCSDHILGKDASCLCASLYALKLSAAMQTQIRNKSPKYHREQLYL